MTSPPHNDDWDPTFLHTRREAIIIVCAWACCFTWVVPYCFLFGYDIDPDNLETILGIPSWVFWGIAVPWVIASTFGIIFSLGYIKDDELGEAEDEKMSPVAEETAGRGGNDE